jgi:hypothetical protein
MAEKIDRKTAIYCRKGECSSFKFIGAFSVCMAEVPCLINEKRVKNGILGLIFTPYPLILCNNWGWRFR